MHSSSSTSELLPAFGMRRRVLGSKVKLQKSLDLLKKVLRTDYHLAIFSAVIKALNCEVIEIARENAALVSFNEEYRFVRDPVVVFHNKKIVISCAGNGEFGSEEILKKFVGYTHIDIKNAYFEGGNMIYLPLLNKVFHGMNPGGYYAKDEGLSLASMTPEEYYKNIPAETNKSLEAQLSPHGIDVEGLELNPEVINHKGFFGKSIWVDNYYHLDCFIQSLPDGRVLVLNKKILSVVSWDKLKNLLGDKLIDLAYAEYLTNPVIFNSVIICKEDNLFLIAAQLPKIVRESLAQHNLTVITPETLTFGSEYYEESYARKVAEILREEGFSKADAKNLATKLAKNENGYRCNNDNVLTYRELKAMKMALSKFYKFQLHRVSFLVDGGGPHCLTTEIVPSLPKISDNTHLLFSPNNIGVKKEPANNHFSEMKFA